MEILEIKKADVISAYEVAKASQKQLLENIFGKKLFQKNVFERIKSMADVFEELNISAEEFDKQTKDLSSDEIAYKKLKLIAEALNEGWTPNWIDTTQKKWGPWFNLVSGFGFSDSVYLYANTYTALGSRLCFKSEKLSDYAATTFIDIYEEFIIIK